MHKTIHPILNNCRSAFLAQLSVRQYAQYNPPPHPSDLVTKTSRLWKNMTRGDEALKLAKQPKQAITEYIAALRSAERLSDGAVKTSVEMKVYSGLMNTEILIVEQSRKPVTKNLMIKANHWRKKARKLVELSSEVDAVDLAVLALDEWVMKAVGWRKGREGSVGELEGGFLECRSLFLELRGEGGEVREEIFGQIDEWLLVLDKAKSGPELPQQETKVSP